MPRWRQILDFPDYSVSDLGDVRNDKRGKPLAVTQNQRGLLKVALTVEGAQYQRALAPLVARGFVEGETDVFNTPIHLDGDQTNCRWDNLVWRPRWFAVRYHAQFRRRSDHTIDVEVRERRTKERYENSFHAAQENGLLERDLVLATLNEDTVFPTWQEFEISGV